MAEEIVVQFRLGDDGVKRDVEKIKRQIDTGLDPSSRHSANEAKEKQHQQRLERIHQQSAAALQTIEARKQAQIDVIRERAAQKELSRQKALADKVRELGNSLSSIGSKLTLGLTAPLAALGIAAVKTATDFDSLTRGLKAVTKDAGPLEAQLARLKEVAKLPGLGFREAIQGSINLQAAGFSAQQAERALKGFGNALATVGKGKSDLDGVILALTQIQSKGKVSAEEINQLAERVPQIRQIMLQAFGTADTEVIQRAKITSGKFIDAVVTQLEKLPQVTGGARNTFENLRDSIEQSLLPLGNKLLETILPAIERLTPKILGLLEGFSKLSPQTQELAIGFAAAAIAAGPLIGALGSILRLVTEIRALGGVTSVLSGVGGAGLGAAGRFLATPLGAGLGVAGLAGIGFGLSTALSERDLEQRIAAGNAIFQDRINPKDLQGNPAFVQFGPNGQPILPPGFQPLDTKGLGGGLVFDQATGTFKRVRTGAGGGTKGSGKTVSDDPTIDAQLLAAQNGKRTRQKSELQKAADSVKEMTEKVDALRAQEGALFVALAKLEILRAQEELLRKQRLDAAQKQAKIELGIPLAPQLPNVGKLPNLPLITSAGPPAAPGIAGLVGRETQAPTAEDQISAARTRGSLADQRLRIQETQIQNQVTQGILTQAEAQTKLNAVRRAARDEIVASLEAQLKVVDANSAEGLQIVEQIERVRTLGDELSNTQRFMRGFGAATETVGDAFERLGNNVSRALTNTKDLLGGLKNAVLTFFNDLLGQSLQNLLRSVLAPLAGLGGVAGGAGAGGIGGIFRTPSTFPANFVSAFAGAAGGNFGAPASVTQSGFNFFGGGGRTSAITSSGSFVNIPNPFATGGGAAGSAATAAGKFSLGGFLGGIGKNLAAAAPFLGFSLGGSIGGTSTAGNLLGGIGGALGGLVLGASTGAIGGSLGSLFALSGTLGPAALIAAPLLLAGGFFLGKAKQRHQDEEASGAMLSQALQSLDQLKAGIASDQIDGNRAGDIFDNEILGPFVQQINSLKTKSVRESRLKNQTRDLRSIYDTIIPPEVEAQRERIRQGQLRAEELRQQSIVHGKLIPQFAFGGLVPGIPTGRDSVLSMLSPGEMVLTAGQQWSVMRQAGAAVFERAGVPQAGLQAGAAQAFQFGGRVQPNSEPIVINVNAVVDADGIFVRGGSSENGRRVIVNQIRRSSLNRE